VTTEKFMMNNHMKYNFLIKFLGRTCHGYHLFRQYSIQYNVFSK